MLGNFINNQWVEGEGEKLFSRNPATGQVLWEGRGVSESQISETILVASNAAVEWSTSKIEARIQVLERFQSEIERNRKQLAEAIAEENGKMLWDAENEMTGAINKFSISLKAYYERCAEREIQTQNGVSLTRHRPHGVVAVFGPFNFPVHLPNGHIIPALIAGNTVILKPSELTPKVSALYISCFEKAGFKPGIISLVQGGSKVGQMLAEHPELNGVFFTGSYKTGQALREFFAKKPGKILALELGGNNPLVVHQISDERAAVYHTIQSAYATAGQRCSCARRLILSAGSKSEIFVEKLIEAIHKIKVGPYTDKPEPFMGPLISDLAAKKVQGAYEDLVNQGARPLVPLQFLKSSNGYDSFVSPALLDVTTVSERPDEEIFGPVLQLIRVRDFEQAVKEANNTAYGLVAGLLCDDQTYYDAFLKQIRAGNVNWNRATTGGSSQQPFGGIGKSGNFRPAGYYSADYCAYPVASLEENELKMPASLPPGLEL